MGKKGYIAEGFLDSGILVGEAALNRTRINNLLSRTFVRCQLTTIKISISLEASLRMARLPVESRRSVEGEIRDTQRLELTQNGNILISFPVIRSPTGRMDVKDTNNQTAASMHHLLQLLSFHELKESSILTELAVWKSQLDQAATPMPPEERSGYRVWIPDPAKCLIMEYCGFADFLEPAIEGN
ncbi:hypothetical protein THAOC_02076 [Thalassiosira oceanica]|uniref:Uncharacterized protein n=1 Tax=Thalassiosira oceanica TaxID=159749 RepID=K0TQJ9_THAOC|nr:hypothetical protein THAOC_02076 [Thalassiosira oceanica]|eukprot:EJK76177.1 hypothetical protein THAOC_02076 [Thalassiosira oceanica]